MSEGVLALDRNGDNSATAAGRKAEQIVWEIWEMRQFWSKCSYFFSKIKIGHQLRVRNGRGY